MLMNHDHFSPEPTDPKAFTEKFDQAYTRFARAYDLIVKMLPLWRNWISTTLPEINGPRVLEVSFGTGYLLGQYANQYETWGMEYNWALTCTARKNLEQIGAKVVLQLGDVTHLPYSSDSFDTVVNTMAFTGYPDGAAALAEIHRVLRSGGRLVMVDINYPSDHNKIGIWLTRMWALGGDLIRDMASLFTQTGFQFTTREIGGFGSVHLYVAVK